MLSAYRRDSRRCCENEAAYANDEGRFACEKFVYHVRDYN
jgi:hypothetical protein